MATPISWAQDIILCDFCDNPTQKFCNNCQANLCGDCINKHIKKNESLTHDIVAYKSRMALPVFPDCEFHTNQKCEAHCEQCDVPVCMKCVISSHNGHIFGDIPHSFHEKKIDIEMGKHENESIILNLKKKQKDLETSINIAKENFDEMKEECERERQIWHSEVDTVFKKLSSLVESLRNNHLTTLESHLSKLQGLITDIINTTQEDKEILTSKKVSDSMGHEIDLQKYENIPRNVVMTIPSIKIKREQGKELVIEIRDYRATLTQTVLSSLPERASDLSSSESLDGAKWLDTNPIHSEKNTCEVQSLDYQDLTLITNVPESQGAQEADKDALEKKSEKNTLDKLKQSFHQLMLDHKDLSEKYETLKSQVRVLKSNIDGEKHTRLRLQEEKMKLENDFKQLQSEKMQLNSDYQQLQKLNQELLDEMENFSKRQFKEMQQRHSSQGFQQSRQQHLRVGNQNHGSPFQFPQHPPQGYPRPWGIFSNRRAPPAVPRSQIISESVEVEEPHQLQCPKCNQTCPDMDTLQIHVLDCIDQYNP